MHFTIPVFERKSGGVLELTTLGLGPRTQGRHGKHPYKVQSDLVEDLRKLAQKARARELLRLRMPRGIRLERVRLELNLAGSERRKVSGVYPIVIEPRWASEDERIFVAYHPERQEDALPIRADVPLDEQLRPWLARAWAELDGDVLGSLWSRGKERIDVLSFSCEQRSLMEDLPRRSGGAKDALGAPDPAFQAKKRRGMQALPKLGQSLTARALSGDLDAGMPRSPYREQLQLLLAAGKAQPVIVVGPPGSGKTTLIHQAVVDMLEADGYAAHRNPDRVREAWHVSGRRIIAGMSHLGDWEKRGVEVLEDARARDVVLVIDDLHHFGRIGRSRESDRSLADFFRGPLARREITIVGECTPEELRALEQDAPSFASLLAPLHVAPATSAETLRLLVRLARELEPAHHVEVSPHALRTILDVGGSLLSGQAFPGKAMDLLLELGRARQGTREAPEGLASRHVYELLSRKTGVPEILLRGDEPLDAAKVEEVFAQQVIGQPEAVKVAVDLVARIKAGLVDPRRPYGVYLFTGPTGTGKTELAKCIAEYLYGSAARLLRFDMSELAGPDAPARLIGHRWAPEGLLTRKVQEQPFSLVLLDEIEKAHPSVHSLLLQLFEDGRLTDASGKTAHFNHTVVIMTSNLGARARASVGFGEAPDAVLHDIARAVREFFPPELFNRIDRIVPFRPLTAEVAERVARKELAKLFRRRGLVERSVFVEAAPGVTERIARVAFVAQDGARSVKRYLEDTVGSLMTEAIAGERPAAMQILRIFPEGEGFGLTRESLDEAQPVDARWALEPLLALPLEKLKDHLPALLGFVEDLEQSDELTRLSERIRHHLAQQMEPAHAEAIYNLDAVRAAVHAFRERIEALQKQADEGEERHDGVEMSRFGWVRVIHPYGGGSVRYRLFHPGQMPSPARHLLRGEVLECIAEGYALRRSLRHVDDPAEHAIFVELLRVGHAGGEARFEEAREGLLGALALAYAGARGEVESWAGRRAGAEVDEGRAGADFDARVAGMRHVVLKIVGLCVRDFFALETGVHVWSALARDPEIVRVRVWPAPAGEAPADVVSRHVEGPGELLPVVRKIRFDPPRRAGATSALELEDYVMGYAETSQVRALGDALEPLWLLRMTREDPS